MLITHITQSLPSFLAQHDAVAAIVVICSERELATHHEPVNVSGEFPASHLSYG
jgi:hypothetical protein